MMILRTSEDTEPVPDNDPLQVQAAEAFASELTSGGTPTIRAIRSRLRERERARLVERMRKLAEVYGDGSVARAFVSRAQSTVPALVDHMRVSRHSRRHGRFEIT
jgi:hypothetical protein